MAEFVRALVGPPEYDYLRTALPVFADAEHAVPESGFREAYESVRPLPAGFERRRDAHALVQTVSYLRALYVRDQHPDTEGRAAWLRERIREMAAELGDRFD